MATTRSLFPSGVHRRNMVMISPRDKHSKKCQFYEKRDRSTCAQGDRPGLLVRLADSAIHQAKL